MSLLQKHHQICLQEVQDIHLQSEENNDIHHIS